MKSGAFLETLIGVIVLVAAGFFLFWAQGRLDEGAGGGGYEVIARFNTVGELSRGAEVRMAGVPVGAVRSISLDTETYFARTDLEIRSDIEIPQDSTARIATAGLLGSAYVEIEPGGAMEMIGEGGEIEFTQGAVDMFDLIGDAVMDRGGSGGGGRARAPRHDFAAKPRELAPHEGFHHCTRRASARRRSGVGAGRRRARARR